MEDEEEVKPSTRGVEVFRSEANMEVNRDPNKASYNTLQNFG